MTWHIILSLVLCMVADSFLSSLFCISNVMVTVSVWCRFLELCEINLPLVKKRIFLIHRILVRFLCFGVGMVRYSQECMAKKKATMPSWPAARLLSVDWFSASFPMRRGGIAFCWTSFPSRFVYPLSCRSKRLEMLPDLLILGLARHYLWRSVPRGPWNFELYLKPGPC